MKWYEFIGLFGSIISVVSAIVAIYQAYHAKKNKIETQKIRDAVYEKFYSYNDIQLMSEINLIIKDLTNQVYKETTLYINTGRNILADVANLLNKIKTQKIFNNNIISYNVNECFNILKDENIDKDKILAITTYLSNISRQIDNKERGE